MNILKKKKQLWKMVTISLLCVGMHMIPMHIANAMKSTKNTQGPISSNNTIMEKTFKRKPFNKSNVTLSGSKSCGSESLSVQEHTSSDYVWPSIVQDAEVDTSSDSHDGCSVFSETTRDSKNAFEFPIERPTQKFPVCDFGADSSESFNDVYDKPKLNLVSTSRACTPPKKRGKYESDSTNTTSIHVYERIPSDLEVDYIDANSKDHIIEIFRQMGDRPIITVCSEVSSMRIPFSTIKGSLMVKLDALAFKFPMKKPIIYFGKDVCFDKDSFINQLINADVIICESAFVKDSFYGNKIDGICILFHPHVKSPKCFFSNSIDDGLFIVGDSDIKATKYPISNDLNSWYLSGEKLMLDNYKIADLSVTSFTDTLRFAMEHKQSIKDIIKVYDSKCIVDEIIDDGANSRENILEILKQMKDRHIIALCPKSPNTSFLNIKNTFAKILNRLKTQYPKENPVIYFGKNMYLGVNSFTHSTILADLIIYKSKIIQNAFIYNKIVGMCVLFEPSMNMERCFRQNITYRGLYIVGDAQSKFVSDGHYPITQDESVYYLAGSGLMGVRRKINILSFFRTFSNTLSFAIENSNLETRKVQPSNFLLHKKAKKLLLLSPEIITKYVTVYNPENVAVYNPYDLERLNEIRKQASDRQIIAVCPPCGFYNYFSFSNVKSVLMDAYFDHCKHSSEKPILYFGKNVHFNMDSVTPDSLGVKEIYADIIICESTFVQDAFHDIKIDGMCILFCPQMCTKNCFYSNNIRYGLFVGGYYKKMAKRFPIYNKSSAETFYLFGDGLVNSALKVKETLVESFSSVFRFALSHSQLILSAMSFYTPTRIYVSDSAVSHISYTFPEVPDADQRINFFPPLIVTSIQAHSIPKIFVKSSASMIVSSSIPIEHMPKSLHSVDTAQTIDSSKSQEQTIFHVFPPIEEVSSISKNPIASAELSYDSKV